MKKDEVKAFKIDVAREVFSDLQKRLKNTRWSYQVEARIGTRALISIISQGTRWLLAGHLRLAKTRSGAELIRPFQNRIRQY